MEQKSFYLITGTSKGIGLALAKKLSEDNAHKVVGVSRTKPDDMPENYFHLSVDLADLEAIEAYKDSLFLQEDFEKIVLINNAGWIGDINYMGTLEDKSIANLFAINTVAPAVLMNDFVKAYGKKSEAKRLVINISSGAANKAIDGWSSYCASKAAVQMLTQVAQVEADKAGTGIRFFSVAPGVVDTEMQNDIRSASEAGFSSLEKFKKLKANGDLSSPEEVASKIIHLIDRSDEFDGVLQDVREF